jgi:soluble lytic murein transglycosylase-like protein
MILPSHYALLTAAADAVALGGVIGEPTKERKSRGTPRARDERGRFVKQDQAAVTERTEAPNIDRAKPEEVDAAYQEAFSTISTVKMEDLLLGSNERLDQLLELIGKWWKWEKRQVQILRAETRERRRLDEMDALHNRQRDQVAQQQQQGGSMLGDMLGGGADIGGNGRDRKRKTRTRRTPTPKKAGFFSRAGGKLLSGMSTAGKAVALAATGALGLAGASTVLGDAPEPEGIDTERNQKPKTETPDVKRTAAAAAEESPDLKRATKAATAEKGLFSRLGGLGKIGGIAGSLLTLGLVGNEVMSIKDNDTLTDKEKDKEYSKLGGATAGSVVGGAGGAWLGAQGGAAAGALVGSVVPILGTAVGAAVGTAVGAVLGGGVGSWFGSEAGEEAGTMVYDVVVRDDQVKKDEDAHKVQAELKSPDLEKLAKAADTKNSGASWWQRLLGIGNGSPTAGNYAQGISGMSYASGGGYGANRDNVIPRAGSPSQRLDYRADPNYVAGQGVLKNLPVNDKLEARLSNWSGLIEEKAAKRGLDPMLVRSVIKQESGGKNDARSGVGASGLMQLMPNTARELGVRDSHDPEQNVEGGTKYLSQMIKMFDGNVPVALAAYNWGPGNMQKLIKRTGSTDINELMPHMPRETQGYVRNITKSHADYQAQAKATEPKAEQADTTVDRDTKAAAEVTVARTDTSDNIVTQTTPPPPPMLAAPAAPKPEGRSATNAQSSSRSRREVPQNIAQAATDPTSLDDMPLLLTDHGLGSILTGRI